MRRSLGLTWLGILLALAVADAATGSDLDSTWVGNVLAACSVALTVLGVVLVAWPAREIGQGNPFFVLHGNWAWLAGAMIAAVGGLALSPFDNGFWVLLPAITLAVAQLNAMSAVHGAMFSWRRRAMWYEVVRYDAGLARRILRSLAMGSCAIGMTLLQLVALYIWQDGGGDYARGFGPLGAAILLVGAGAYWLATGESLRLRRDLSTSPLRIVRQSEAGPQRRSSRRQGVSPEHDP